MPEEDDDTSEGHDGLSRAKTRKLGDRSLEGLSEVVEGVQATEAESGDGGASPCTIHYDGESADMTPTEPDEL